MMIAPAYRRIDGEQLVFGLRIDSSRTNMHGDAHGGMLVTLVDGALHDESDSWASSGCAPLAGRVTVTGLRRTGQHVEAICAPGVVDTRLASARPRT